MTASESGATALQGAPAGVVIYTHSLLSASMTFVKSHAEALTRYRPLYVGARRVDGIELPADRTYVLNDGTAFGMIREAMFRQWDWAPTLVRKLRAQGPQIVHAHFGTSGPAGLALANSLGVPLVVTFHGHDATMHATEATRSHRGRELLKKKPRLIAQAGAFIAVSEYIRTRLLAQGYPEARVVLHRNGIDLDFFKPPARTSSEPIILFVGRFVEKKGARYLVEAASELSRAGVAYQLVMIGNGPNESELKNAAARARIPCRFPGFLALDEVKSWLGKACVVAVPSVTASNGDTEGLPTVLLEAQAMAVPVVATRHSGIPEGVREGVTAELVDEKDVATLAEKLRSFLQDPVKARAFGDAGRRFVCDNFDLRAQVNGLEEIYARLIAQRASSL